MQLSAYSVRYKVVYWNPDKGRWLVGKVSSRGLRATFLDPGSAVELYEDLLTERVPLAEYSKYATKDSPMHVVKVSTYLAKYEDGSLSEFVTKERLTETISINDYQERRLYV